MKLEEMARYQASLYNSTTGRSGCPDCKYRGDYLMTWQHPTGRWYNTRVVCKCQRGGQNNDGVGG